MWNNPCYNAFCHQTIKTCILIFIIACYRPKSLQRHILTHFLRMKLLLSTYTLECKQEDQMLWWLTLKCRITKIISVMSLKYMLVTQHTVLDLFKVCSNHAPLNYSGQESEINLQFMILTYLWPWNVKVIKPGING